MDFHRIAFFGAPGAGKSTTTQLLAHYCEARRIPFKKLRLAEPLYACQQAIYTIAGKPLHDHYSQDGALLNSLGFHLRQINPTVLTDYFSSQLCQVEYSFARLDAPYSMVVCDDMRWPDYPFMVNNGFALIRIEAPPEMCLQRRRLRRDLTVGSASHATEQGLDGITPDYVLANTSTLSNLEVSLHKLLSEMIK